MEVVVTYSHVYQTQPPNPSLTPTQAADDPMDEGCGDHVIPRPLGCTHLQEQ
jgi:hypothetical protein